MKKSRLILAFLAMMLIGSTAFAQNITVKGTVTDGATGDPVPFASIVVKGTSTGVATDIDGNYTLAVAKNATLVISSIGYTTQEAAVEGRTVINVILAPDTEMLEETVVVAYGVAKRESVTGAISTVKSDAIEKRPISNVSNALDGTVTGVLAIPDGDPGESAGIRIRGVGSVTGDNSPLYVVDGVPMGGNMGDINPNDIESLTVLKDATSAALYGNRASNGVILITTKRGKSDKAGISLSVNQGIFTRALPEYDKVDAKDFMQVFFTGYMNNLISNAGMTREQAIADVRTNLLTYIGEYNIFDIPTETLFNAEGKFNYAANIRGGYDDLDWWAVTMRTGYRQDYNVSGSGASEKSNYYFSLGYLDEEGQTVNSDFSRWSGRANVSISPVKWLKAGANISASWQGRNYRNTGSTTFANPLYQAHVMAPIYPVYMHNPDGTYMLDDNGQKQYDVGELYGRPQYNARCAIWEAQLDTRYNQRVTTNAQAYADITFLKDFTFSIKGDLGLRTDKTRTYNNAIIGDGRGANGRTSRTDYFYTNYTFQQLLNWHREFGDHTLEALAGHENYYYQYEYTYLYKQDQTLPGGIELDNLNSMTSMEGYQSGYRLESYLSRIKYDYINKYFLEGSFRRDGSSRFHRDYRWGNFWSAGATWVISKEEFMKNVSWIDNLRIRASYGQVGNDASVGYYGYMALYGLGSKYGGSAASYKTQNEAPDLVWEAENSFSTAIEGRMFDRLNFTFEFFNKTTHDLLFDVEHPTSVGGISGSSVTTATTQNIGSVRNIGVETSIDVDIIKTREVTWNFGVNATWMKNTILKLPDADIYNYDGMQNAMRSGTKLWAEGHGIYDWNLYQFIGVDQLTGLALYAINDEDYYILEENKMGKVWNQQKYEETHDVSSSFDEVEKTIVPEEYRVVIDGKEYVTHTTYAKRDWGGSSLPKVYGNFNTSLRVKNFTLSALFSYALGSKCLDYAYQDLMSVGVGPHAYHIDLLNSWSEAPAGMTADSPDRIDPTGIPRIDGFYNTYSNATSTRFLVSGNYLTIKNVNFAYTFPRRTISRVGLNGLVLSASVDNLWSFTAKRGMNPQQAWSGLIYGSYVNIPRVATVGVKVNL